MKEGNFILLDKTVFTKWNSKTKKYYLNKGYTFTKLGELFEVKTEDLPHSSEVKVKVKCDYCGSEYYILFASYYQSQRNGKTACKKCACKRTEEAMLYKYGVKNPFELECVREKTENTLLQRYGVKNISQLQKTQEKIKKNNLEKYGVTNTSKLDSVKQKVILSNRKKFGVDYPMQLKEFQDKIKKTSLEKYGVAHFTQNKDVIQKRKQTNLSKYGVAFPIQNKEILSKSINSRYKHGNFTCSKQQYELHQHIGGKLNYPFEHFVIDVAFPDNKIAVEWDGSGHDLSVRMNRITESEFKRNENFRYKKLFEDNWKVIRFITKKDIFPKNFDEIFNFCLSYIKDGGHYIKVLIDDNIIQYKNLKININDIC